MNQEEKAIYDNIMSAIKANQLSKEDVAEMINSSDLRTKEIEALKAEHQTQLDTLGAEVKALKENAPRHRKSLSEVIKEQTKDISEKLKSQEKVSFTLKTSDVLKATVLPTSITSDGNGVFLPDIGQLATKKTKIVDLFSQFPLGADSHGIVYYMDQSTATRNAAARTVGNSAAESVLAWTQYSQSLGSITDSIPFAKEMLTRYSAMEAEIMNFIKTNLILKRDTDYVTGDGSAPDIKGVYTYASAFDSAAYTGFKPNNATLFDLIAVMAAEVENGTKYSVDYALVNPADTLALTLEKDKNDNRINLPLVQADGSIKVKQVMVIETNSVTANTLVLGDFSRARRYFGEDITLELGYNASGDFAKRILTLVGNMEELLLVRTCEADAFLKSTDITTDVANISTVVA